MSNKNSSDLPKNELNKESVEQTDFSLDEIIREAGVVNRRHEKTEPGLIDDILKDIAPDVFGKKEANDQTPTVEEVEASIARLFKEEQENPDNPEESASEKSSVQDAIIKAEAESEDEGGNGDAVAEQSAENPPRVPPQAPQTENSEYEEKPENIQTDEEENDDEEDDEESEPPVKRLSVWAFFRQRRAARETENDDEKLDQEPVQKVLVRDESLRSTVEYARKVSSRAKKLIPLTMISFLLTIAENYVILAQQTKLPWPSMFHYLETPYFLLLIVELIHIIGMAVAIQIMAEGLRTLFALRAGVYSVVCLANIACFAHALTVVLTGEYGFLPFSGVAMLMLTACLFSEFLRASASARACKTALSTMSPIGVFAMGESAGMLIKCPIDNVDFLGWNYEQEDNSSRFWCVAAPIVLVAGFVFSLMNSFGTGEGKRFFWALSAQYCAAAPIFAALSFWFPFNEFSKVLARVGGALAGIPGARKARRIRSAVLTDTDLFPDGAVSLNGLKVFGDYSLDRVIGYTASILKEASSGLTDIFSDLLRNQSAQYYTVTRLEISDAGGYFAEVNDDTVVVGSASFMLRNGIRVAEGVNIKNAVFVAINSRLAGIFGIKYVVLSDVRRSILFLKNRHVAPVLASMDFNIQPSMVELAFKLNPDVIEYPEAEDRIVLNNLHPTEENTLCAVMNKDDIVPYVESIYAGKRAWSRAKRNNIWCAIASVVGNLFMLYLIRSGGYSSITPYNLLLFSLVWAIPPYMASLFSSRL